MCSTSYYALRLLLPFNALLFALSLLICLPCLPCIHGRLQPCVSVSPIACGGVTQPRPPVVCNGNVGNETTTTIAREQKAKRGNDKVNAGKCNFLVSSGTWRPSTATEANYRNCHRSGNVQTTLASSPLFTLGVAETIVKLSLNR